MKDIIEMQNNVFFLQNYWLFEGREDYFNYIFNFRINF